jgi:hypothetical protein
MIADYDDDPLSRCATMMRQQEAQEQADADRARQQAAAEFEDKMIARQVRDRAETLEHGAPLREIEAAKQHRAEQRAGRIAELTAELGRLDPGRFGADAPAAARFGLTLPDDAGEVTVSTEHAAALAPHAPESLLARSAAGDAEWNGPLLAVRRAAAEAEHARVRESRPGRAPRPRPREVTRTAAAPRPPAAPLSVPPQARPFLPAGDY